MIDFRGLGGEARCFAAVCKLLFAQRLMEKLIKLPDKVGCHSSDGVFVYKMLQIILLSGHQVQEFDTIELILKRSSHAQI